MLKLNTKSKQTTLKLVSVLVLSFIAFLSFGSHASAASLTVNSTLDTAANDGSCTLREAIININTQTNAVNTDCAAGDGSSDTINLPTGNITLAADLPNINLPTIIQGQGIGQSEINGNNGQYEVFNFSGVGIARGLSIRAFEGVAITSASELGAITIDQVEVDGTNALPAGPIGGILILTPQAAISNTYIHSLSANGVVSLFGLSVQTAQGISTTVNVENVTVDNINSLDSNITGINFASGLFDGSLTPGNINATVKNSTISNLNSDSNSVSGVSAASMVSGGSSEVDLIADNTTTNNLTGNNGFLGNSSNFVVAGAALTANDTSTVTLRSTNNLLAGPSDSCSFIPDLAPAFGAGVSLGSVNASFISGGGNLSDDSACSPYFNQPTDQNNLTNLASTLGQLSDNGGYVPTIPLLAGSPAIDAGVNVASLTSDARLAARPQGSAFDTGAYESPYFKTEVNAASSLAATGERIGLFVVAGVGLVALSIAVLIKQRRDKK